MIPVPAIAAPVPITARQYQELPDAEMRVEVVDGYVHVSPSPTPIHQNTVGNLRDLLKAQGPPGLACFFGIDVRLQDDPLNVRVPDLVVVRGTIQGVLRSDQVLLAVEVVSPGTVTVDRVHKRQEYAAAGIPNYWLVDWSNGVSLEVLRLVGDRYVSGGAFNQESAQIESPFPCTIDLGELPR